MSFLIANFPFAIIAFWNESKQKWAFVHFDIWPDNWNDFHMQKINKSTKNMNKRNKYVFLLKIVDISHEKRLE